MPRRRTSPSPEPAPAQVPDIFVVNPTSIFTSESFRRLFGLRASSLRREVRERRLRVHKRCGKYLIIGEDVLAWIRGGAVLRHQPPKSPPDAA